MNKERYYKFVFLMAALWNWVLGLGFILVTVFFASLAAPVFGTELPPSLLWIHGFFFLVFVIGFAFFFASFDVKNNLAVAKFGIVDKYLIFPFMFIYFLLGDINVLGLLPTVVDVIFATLFLEFLLNYKKL